MSPYLVVRHVFATQASRPNAGADGLQKTHFLGGTERARVGEQCLPNWSYSDPSWLLSGFGVVSIGSRDQGGDEGAKERLPAAPGVVHELEEAEIGGQLLLGDAAVRPQPGTQQRPDPLHGVDVDLAEAVAVLVAGVRAPAVTGDRSALATRAADAVGPAVLAHQLVPPRVIDQRRQVHQGRHGRHQCSGRTHPQPSIAPIGTLAGRPPRNPTRATTFIL